MTECGKAERGIVYTEASIFMEKVVGTLGEGFEDNNFGVGFTYNSADSNSELWK